MQASVDLGGRRIIKKKIFFKQKTAYEIGGSDWSSDVCSSDLVGGERQLPIIIGATEAQAMVPESRLALEVQIVPSWYR